MDQGKKEESILDIDIIQIVQALLKNIFIIILAMIIGAGVMLAYSKMKFLPLYRSSAMMYVNTRTFSVDSIAIGSVNVSTSTLLDLYSTILKTRVTLEEVIEQAELPYSYSQLSSMISTNAVASTGVFQVTVTCTDPSRTKLIVDTIVDVLPRRIMEILDGSSVRIVDYAVRPTYPVNSTGNSYILIGLAIGFVITAGITALLTMLDTTVKDEKYVIDTFHLPVLAVIPDNNVHGSKYGKYRRYGKYSRYGRYTKYGKYYAKNYQYYAEPGHHDSGQDAAK